MGLLPQPCATVKKQFVVVLVLTRTRNWRRVIQPPGHGSFHRCVGVVGAEILPQSDGDSEHRCKVRNHAVNLNRDVRSAEWIAASAGCGRPHDAQPLR